MAKIFGIIGTGRIVIECIRYMLSFKDVEIPFVFYDPDSVLKNQLIEFCAGKDIETYGVEKINSLESLRIIKHAQPDIILSINNFKIIKPEMIKIPRNGIINFHNGPLPKYRGVNAVSWAILNGEKTHGVTFHFIDESIDTGNIVGKKIFGLDDNTTAGRLFAQCVSEGIQLFKDIFPDIYRDSVTGLPQQGESSYYSLKDFPDNNGIIDFNWTYEKINRVVKGLNYIPFQNEFVYARLNSTGTPIIINEVSLIGNKNENNRPGEIIKLDEEQLLIACSDGIAGIDEMMNEKNEYLSPPDVSNILNVKTGDVIH